MNESKKKYPAKAVKRQEVVTAGVLRSVDWHQQIKRRGKEWPAKAVRLPMEVAAVATAAGRKERNKESKKHTPDGCVSLLGTNGRVCAPL